MVPIFFTSSSYIESGRMRKRQTTHSQTTAVENAVIKQKMPVFPALPGTLPLEQTTVTATPGILPPSLLAASRTVLRLNAAMGL